MQKSRLVMSVEIAATLSVLVGLLLVFLELRQSNQHATAESTREIYQEWSETYDRELNDIFVLQDEITSAIVKALRITLSHRSDSEMVSLTATENVEAYKLYLRGRHLWRRRQTDSIHRSIELFKEAVGLDPTFARAWSNLAAAPAPSRILPSTVGLKATLGVQTRGAW